jgi:hypothetical protein
MVEYNISTGLYLVYLIFYPIYILGCIMLFCLIFYIPESENIILNIGVDSYMERLGVGLLLSDLEMNIIKKTLKKDPSLKRYIKPDILKLINEMR